MGVDSQISNVDGGISGGMGSDASRSTARSNARRERKAVDSEAVSGQALEDVACQVLAGGQRGQAAGDGVGIDHVFAGGAAGVEGNVLQQFFHHRVQAAGADVLGALVHLEGDFGDAADAVVGEFQRHAFGRQQGFVLPRQAGIG